MNDALPEEQNEQIEDEIIEEESPSSSTFPIVGIGASAGGLKAFENFFTNMPPDSGMAFVLIQHLDPNHESMLVDLVRRYTRMSVEQVTDAMQVEPNHIYIIPPNADLAIMRGELHLMEPKAPRGYRLPIDFFFRSLAEDMGERAICVVLSGTGSDGTLGLRAVKEAGGLTMVQAPETAKYDGMPVSAIATDLADFVLPTEEMPKKLIGFVQHASRIEKEIRAKEIPYDSETLQKIFIVLRSQSGHDFSQYKKNTIIRRIERRMALNKIENFRDYLRYLRHNPLEVDILFQDLLIGVTSFFRDKEAFEVLENQIIPSLFKDKAPEESVRVWVCGTSTGEEAYSIAILLKEYAEENGQRNSIQIFATDIDDQSIEKARQSIYPDNIAADVTPGRLERYFSLVDGNKYQINSQIRDMVIFATQNVIKDPPFSKIDLISCRNLLIYMDNSLQRRVLRLFHYALNPEGYLMLGTSETLGELKSSFNVIDRKQKIFQRGDTPPQPQPTFDFTSRSGTLLDDTDPINSPGARINMRDVTEQVLLEEHVPVGILINERCQIMYTHGRTGKYLEIVTGEASNNVLNMAREGLKIPLTTAVRKVIAQKQPIVHKLLHVKTNGNTQTVKLTVKPVDKPAAVQGLILILIEDVVLPDKDKEASQVELDHTKPHQQRIVELEQELNSTRQYLQTTIEELETSNEELKSTNEELQSSNEELQSTNEELETTKEELQSINEELMTVNTELESKIEQLSHSNNDLNNLLASIGIAIIFLDMNLNVQRFNPSAAQLINLIESDVGRPIGHLVKNFTYDGFTADAEHILNTLEPVEEEVQTVDGRWFTMRMRPYRTIDYDIAGVIVTFAEITRQKEAQEELAVLNNVVEQAYSVVIITGSEGTIEYVNPQYEELLGFKRNEVIGQHFTFNSTLSSQAEQREELWNTISAGEIWRGEINIFDRKGQQTCFLTTIVPVTNQANEIEQFVLINDDITDIKQLEKELRNSEMLYRRLARRLPNVAILVFDHELRYRVAEGASLEEAGYHRGEIEGRTFYDVVPKERQADLEPLYQAALAGKEKYTTYTSTSNKRFRLQAVPLDKDGESRFGGMIVIYQIDK